MGYRFFRSTLACFLICSPFLQAQDMGGSRALVVVTGDIKSGLRFEDVRTGMEKGRVLAELAKSYDLERIFTLEDIGVEGWRVTEKGSQGLRRLGTMYFQEGKVSGIARQVGLFLQSDDAVSFARDLFRILHPLTHPIEVKDTVTMLFADAGDRDAVVRVYLRETLTVGSGETREILFKFGTSTIKIEIFSPDSGPVFVVVDEITGSK